MLVVTLNIIAHNDVTTFLGIPIDGSKSEMQEKLIKKGFRKVTGEDYLQGEFNGTEVYLIIGTNNNKVFRISLVYVNQQKEAEIKNSFNRLVSQFETNKRYIALSKQYISDNENISYEMLVNNKTYEATFYQNINLERIDTLAMQYKIKQELLKKYSEEQINNSTPKIIEDAKNILFTIEGELVLKKPVWFRIERNYKDYYIIIRYDNEYNHADGEDL